MEEDIIKHHYTSSLNILLINLFSTPHGTTDSPRTAIKESTEFQIIVICMTKSATLYVPHNIVYYHHGN